MGSDVARMEEGRDTFKILTSKPKGKRPSGTPRRRWEHNIRMDFTEIDINEKQNQKYIRQLYTR